MIQENSSFCELCNTCIGHGLLIENICFRHGAICKSCRWELINENVHLFNLPPLFDSLDKDQIPSTDEELLQLEKHNENSQHLKIIALIDEAVANWEDKHAKNL